MRCVAFCYGNDEIRSDVMVTIELIVENVGPSKVVLRSIRLSRLTSRFDTSTQLVHDTNRGADCDSGNAALAKIWIVFKMHLKEFWNDRVRYKIHSNCRIVLHLSRYLLLTAHANF